MPVRGKLKVFEFSSNPYIDAQNQLQGVEINVCMRLVHHVLVQGLGTTMTGKKQHTMTAALSPASTCATCRKWRSGSSVSCCTPAVRMIPANNEKIRLPIPSPDFESNTRPSSSTTVTTTFGTLNCIAQGARATTCCASTPDGHGQPTGL